MNKMIYDIMLCLYTCNYAKINFSFGIQMKSDSPDSKPRALSNVDSIELPLKAVHTSQNK